MGMARDALEPSEWPWKFRVHLSADKRPATSRLTPRLRIPLALRQKTILGRAVQWLALGADCLAFAGVLLAFLHEAVFGGAVQRLALGADCLAFAGLRHGRADGEKCDRSCKSQSRKSQSCRSYAFHRDLPVLRS